MTLLYVALGTVFGLVLSRSGAADYDYIQGMFLFERFQLYGIMGTGVVLTAPGLWLLKRRGRTWSGTPIGVLESDAGFTLVDAAGVELSTTPEQPAGQPVLDIAGDPDSAAFRSAGLVVRSLPADLRATVTKVTARSGDDVTFTTNAGLTVVWGSDKDSVEKAIVLVELIKAAPDARSFDVSSPRVPVVG